MRKILSSLLVAGLVLVLCSPAFADSARTTPLSSSGALTSNQVVTSRGIDVYRIMFNTTLTSSLGAGEFGLYDTTGLGTASASLCKVEIYEATDGDGHYIDFGENPLKFDTGCTLVIDSGAVVLHYR